MMPNRATEKAPRDLGSLTVRCASCASRTEITECPPVAYLTHFANGCARYKCAVGHRFAPPEARASEAPL